MTFLDEIADRLIESHGHDLKECAVVLPSKRSSLFLKKALSKRISGTFWAPLTFNFTELISRYNQDIILDKTSLSFELFEVYNGLTGDNSESFDQFYKWGEILLSDFNDIDLYQLEAAEVFQDLRNIQALESWDTDTHTELQKRYMSFWKGLAPLYDEFNKHLQIKGFNYTGAVYKKVARQLNESGIEESEFQSLYFCGLNALSPCEIDIIRSFKNNMSTEVIWDLDQHYIENPYHEAGHFYRTITKKFPELQGGEIRNHLNTPNKNITIYEGSSSIAQTKIAAQILEEILPGSAHENCAVVLPEPSLLLPLIHELPMAVQTANVTMGFPINKTEVHSLIIHLISLQENTIKYENNKNDIFHFKPFQRFIKHPILRGLFQKELEVLDTEIREGNKVFIEGSDLHKVTLYKDMPTLFKRWKNLSTEPVNAILLLLDYLHPRLEKDYDRNKINLQSLSVLKEALLKLGQIVAQYPYISRVSTFKRVFNNVVNNHELSFYGEPLSGLQIMGLLESRALDFDNLIVLSLNEGVIPRGIYDTSILPYDLKKHHGIPSTREKDAVMSNHFFRLLQRARNVHLIYSPLTDRFGSGEKSRFLLQLEEELKDANISYRQFKTPLGSKPDDNTVQKDQLFYDLLEKQLVEKGLSASALNKFIRCPLDFYYTYICGIREDENVKEDIEDNSMGIIVHNILEDLYEPFIGQQLNATVLRNNLKNVAALTESRFKLHLNQKKLLGINYLSKEIAITQVEKVIMSDISDLESGSSIEILGTEQKVKSSFPYQLGSKKIQVNVNGTIDRVDCRNGIIRLIDYKTGSVNEASVKPLDLTTEVTATNGISLQLAFYSYIYGKLDPDVEINSWVIAVKNNKQLLYHGRIKNSISFGVEFRTSFEKYLSKIIDRMTDSEVELVHNPESKYCQVCL